MPQAHGRNSKLVILDSTGTLFNIAPDVNDITLTWNRKNSETTTMGNDTVQRIAGLKDATLKGSGVWNTGASKIDNVLNGILAGSIITLVSFAPLSATGCVIYNACMVMSDYAVKSNVKDAVMVDFTFEMASGSVTVGTAT